MKLSNRKKLTFYYNLYWQLAYHNKLYVIWQFKVVVGSGTD